MRAYCSWLCVVKICAVVYRAVMGGWVHLAIWIGLQTFFQNSIVSKGQHGRESLRISVILDMRISANMLDFAL